jgi:hypothetical protein
MKCQSCGGKDLVVVCNDCKGSMRLTETDQLGLHKIKVEMMKEKIMTLQVSPSLNGFELEEAAQQIVDDMERLP